MKILMLLILLMSSFPSLAYKKATPYKILKENTVTTDNRVKNFYFTRYAVQKDISITEKLSNISKKLLLFKLTGIKFKVDEPKIFYVEEIHFDTKQRTLSEKKVEYIAKTYWDSEFKKYLNILFEQDREFEFIYRDNSELISKMNHVRFNPRGLVGVEHNIEKLALTAKLGKVRLSPYIYLAKNLQKVNPLLDLYQLKKKRLIIENIKVELATNWWNDEDSFYFIVRKYKDLDSHSFEYSIESSDISLFQMITKTEFVKSLLLAIRNDFLMLKKLIN